MEERKDENGKEECRKERIRMARKKDEDVEKG
jgi:hypothetical protein